MNFLLVRATIFLLGISHSSMPCLFVYVGLSFLFYVGSKANRGSHCMEYKVSNKMKRTRWG